MRDMTPDKRQEQIVCALRHTYGCTPEQAVGILAAHTANELRVLGEDMNTLDNPYRLNRARTQWAEGRLAATGRMFMRELRLRALAEQAAGRRLPRPVTDRRHYEADHIES